MLQTDLDAAIAKAAALQEDLDDANTDLETAEDDLMTANDMVTDLETLIGDETNPDPASVRGMLAQANKDLETARTDLQMAVDNSADVMEIDRLTKAVTAAEGMRDGYKTDLDAANLELDGDGTTEGLRDKVTSLTDELKTANDNIEILGEAVRLAGAATVIAIANSEYVAAKKAYDDLMAAYGKADADVDAARALVAAANAAKAKADAAQTVAGSGTVAQMTAAAVNVAAADLAVGAAAYELKQAMTTVAAMPYAMAIMTQATEPMALAASATRTDNAVEVSVSSGDPAVLIAKGSGSDAGHGWYRANVANEDGDQTATVYTNIENTMEKFDAVHVVAKPYIGAVADGVLELEESGQFQDLNKYVSAAAFPGASEGSLTKDYDGTDDNPSKFDGTFDGVPGSYNCAVTCTATADSDGELTALTGEWTFIPAYLGEDGLSDPGEEVGKLTREDDLPVPNVAVPDVDYLWYGSWAQVAKDGTVAFQTFFGGEEEVTTAIIADLEGTAMRTAEQ